MNNKYDLATVQQLMSNQFKILQTKVEVLSKRKGYKKIAISSSIANEGKTFFSTSLSRQLALSGGKVLLIDADIRKPDVAQRINLAPAPGLAEYIGGALKIDQVIQITNTKGLHAISGGNPDGAPDIAASRKLNELLVSLEKNYDYIIIDTPPVVPVPDTVSIKNIVDGVIFVFGLGFTPYDLFSKAIEDVGSDKIIGVVLNYANYDKIVNKKYYKYYDYGHRYATNKDKDSDKSARTQNI